MAKFVELPKAGGKLELPTPELVDTLTDKLIGMEIGSALVIKLGEGDESVSAYRSAIRSIAEAQGLVIGVRASRREEGTINVWRKNPARCGPRKKSEVL